MVKRHSDSVAPSLIKVVHSVINDIYERLTVMGEGLFRACG